MKSRKKNKGKRPGKARKKGAGPESPPKLIAPKFRSHAPKPIKPMGGGGYVWRPSRDPHRTFTANEPMREPHPFPNLLRPSLDLAITDAGNDFPLVAQTRQRVGRIISDVGKSVCVAARDGLLRSDLARPALQDLLDCLSDYYYEHSYSNWESYDRKLKREIKASEEWRGFLVELVELAETRKLHVGQESDPKPKATATTEAGSRGAGSPAPIQDEPAIPQPADITDGETRAGPERLTGLADSPSDTERPSKLAPTEIEGEEAMADPAPVANISNGRDTVAAERTALLHAYKEAGKKQGVRITDKMIAQAASPGHWTERTPVQRWKRNDDRCTPGYDVSIRAVLRNKPHLK